LPCTASHNLHCYGTGYSSSTTEYLSAQDHFLSAVINNSNSKSLSTFDQQWLTLLKDCEESLPELPDETKELMAFVVSSNISLLADSLIASEELENTVSLSREFNSVAANYLFPESIEVTLPIYPSAWFLQNLHNPYPPPALKSLMEQATSRKLGEWFSRMRQRIGWTRVMHKWFGGSRPATIDAAFRAYVRDDPNSPLDPQLLAEFMAIKAEAKFILGSRSVSRAPSLSHTSKTDDSDDDISVPRVGQKRSNSQSSVDLSIPNDDERSKRHRYVIYSHIFSVIDFC
jgi:Homeobox KN domain